MRKAAAVLLCCLAASALFAHEAFAQAADLEKCLKNPPEGTRHEKGKVYTLKMDLWSTALVFNRSHHIAVLVTSSSTPA